MVKPIKTMIYNRKFILFWGVYLVFSSTLHSAQQQRELQDTSNQVANRSRPVRAGVRERHFSKLMLPSPPSTYVCHKCGIPGHWLQQCSTTIYRQYAPPKYYVCHKCGVGGHWVEQCKRTTYQKLAPPSNYICHKCHIAGHWVVDCPKKQYKAHYTPTADIWSCKWIKSCKALLIIKECLAYWDICQRQDMVKHILHYLSSANHYRNIVSAYHHLLNAHLNHRDNGNNYKYINATLRQHICCDFKTCKGYTRNQRQRGKVARKADNDKEAMFLQDLLDTIHAYLLHGYDSGHRYAKGGHPNISQKAESTNALQLFDYEMKALAAWQANIKEQGRMQDKKDKFQTKIHQIKAPLADRKISLALLAEKSGNDKACQQWLQYLKQNECDTDNVLAEVVEAELTEESVLAIDTALRAKIKAYRQQDEKKGLYGFGVRLYYWDYYRYNEQAHWEINPDTRYKDLYVWQIFLSFKDEILAKDITITQWNQAMFEAYTLLCQSHILRKITAAGGKNSLCTIYNIIANSGLAVYHVLSMLLYTNFTALSSAFSASLRYLSPAESVESIVSRNGEWYHLSKYLREVVEVFGEQIGIDQHDNNIDRGSFYHGVPYLWFSSFSVHYYGPLSTSKQLAVAMLFANNDGLIVELRQGASWTDKYLRFFNVGLVSCFAAEDERLFMGGRSCLQIASIRLVKDHMNSAPLTHTLFIIHHMIKGEELDRDSNVVVRYSDISIFKKLLSSWQYLPDYVQQTWKVFRNEQQSVKIHMGYMYKYYNLFIPLLFDLKSSNALLLDTIVNIFPNVTEIICEAIDNITGNCKRKDHSPAIVDANFVLVLQKRLHKLRQNKRAKLKRVVIKTSQYNIKVNCNAYATHFTTLGWQIGLGPRTIVVTKTAYTDCIIKISSMVEGKCPSIEATSLDIAMWQKLVTGAKDVPSEAKKAWYAYRHRWQEITINLRYMHKYYALWLPVLCSPNPKYKNLLLLDKLSTIFPNVTHIICERADWDPNKIDKNRNKGAYSSSIVGSNFIFGIKDMLHKMIQQKGCKLKQITIQTYQNRVRYERDLYPKQLRLLGWEIKQENTTLQNKAAKTIYLTKNNW